MKIGEKIKNYRQRAGFSQMDLELAIDAAFGSMSRIENNKVNPTKETLSRIAKYLRLKPSELADLMDLQIFSTEDLIGAINKFSKYLTLKDTLQTAVDSLFNLFPNYNGGVIFLVNFADNTLHSQTVASMPLMELAIKYLPKPMHKLTVKIEQKSPNLVVQSIIQGKPIQSKNLGDFSCGGTSFLAGQTVGKILGYKMGVSIPIVVDGETIGAVMYAKRTPEEFTEEEIRLLSLLNEQIGISIQKCRIVEGKKFI